MFKRVVDISRYLLVSKTEKHYLVFSSYAIKKGRTVDALTPKDEEGRCRVRKAPDRSQATFDPEISEWGNPSADEADIAY